MSGRKLVWVLIAFLTAGIPAGMSAPAAPGAGSRRGVLPPGPAAYRLDRILLRPKAGVSLGRLAAFHAKRGHTLLRTFSRIRNIQVLRLRGGANLAAEIAAYEASGLVDYAEPDYIVRATDVNPNDFYYVQGNQWGLNNNGMYGTAGDCIHAPQAWNIRTSASNVIVAVVDTGILLTHEDLAANLWTNPNPGDDGFSGDVHGINAITGTGDPTDDNGHGTNVAGIIGAVGNNTVGVAGVCWNVQLMALKFLDSNASGSVSDAITCLDYAIFNHANIVNASWGGYNFTSSALMDAVNALRNAGIIFVAACGNNDNNNDSYSLYPASYDYDNVISVAATDWNDQLCSFSNFGASTVHLGAPGQNIFSCWNGSNSDYESDTGTSQAAPFVSGACALVWAQYPNLSPLQVINQVLNGVDRVPSLAGITITGGRLDLANALQPPPNVTPPPQTIWVDDALPAGAVADTPADSGGSWTDDAWTWVSSDPAPYSGAASFQTGIDSGIHLLSFQGAAPTMPVYSGDTLFAYVYLDPDNPPTEVMLSWMDSCWEHRAYWGQNSIPWGENGTSDCLYMGPLPPVGQWVCLSVPAHSMMLEGASLQGMSFMLDNGRAAFDCAGRYAAGATPP